MTTHRLAACALLLQIGCAATLSAADPGPVLGPVFELTEANSVCQQDQQVMPLRSGGFVTAWTTQEPGRSGVLSRTADAAARLGPITELSGGELAALGVTAAGDRSLLLRQVSGLVLRRVSAAGQTGGPDVALPVHAEWPNVAAAFAADGRFAVVWLSDDRLLGRWFTAAGVPSGAEVELDRMPHPVVPLSDNRVAATLDSAGRAVAVWARKLAPGYSGLAAVHFRRFDLGNALGPAVMVGQPDSPVAYEQMPAVAATRDGGVTIAWVRTETPVFLTHVLYRSFDGADQPLAAATAASPQYAVAPSLASDGQDRLALAWQSADRGTASLLLLTPAGPEGPAIPLHAELDGADILEFPSVAILADGRIAVVWSTYQIPYFEPVGCEYQGISGRIVTPPFSATEPPALLLGDGRFRATIAWRTRDGASGFGTPLPLGGDSGAFWFFAPDNLELMLKVLDGRAVNGAFWVFYATLTDVAFDLTVTDTETGQSKVYSKPQGRIESRADVHAFPAPGDDFLALESPATATTAAAAAPQGDDFSPAVCPLSASALCLAGQYSVSVRFTDPRDGTSHDALPLPLTASGGAFWFFQPDNVELMVKIVQGYPVNGHVWFFFGGLSDVAYDITVTDTGTGASRTYRNPRGRLTSGADTQAF
jgi:hypothetical protein